MGVLPPKLARMMINFTALRDGVIWDPFCGSGTILIYQLSLSAGIVITTKIQQLS